MAADKITFSRIGQARGLLCSCDPSTGCGGGGGGGGGTAALIRLPREAVQLRHQLVPRVYSSRQPSSRINAPIRGLAMIREADPSRTSKARCLTENHWLRSWTNELYLWYREVPDLNPVGYPRRLNYFHSTEDACHHPVWQSERQISFHVSH